MFTIELNIFHEPDTLLIMIDLIRKNNPRITHRSRKNFRFRLREYEVKLPLQLDVVPAKYITVKLVMKLP